MGKWVGLFAYHDGQGRHTIIANLKYCLDTKSHMICFVFLQEVELSEGANSSALTNIVESPLTSSGCVEMSGCIIFQHARDLVLRVLTWKISPETLHCGLGYHGTHVWKYCNGKQFQSVNDRTWWWYRRDKKSRRGIWAPRELSADKTSILGSIDWLALPLPVPVVLRLAPALPVAANPHRDAGTMILNQWSRGRMRVFTAPTMYIFSLAAPITLFKF